MKPATAEPVAAEQVPSPTRSPLLGFLARIEPGRRYALYPAGRYTRACVEDLPEACLETEGRRLLGFIDDDPDRGSFLGRPVASLSDAVASWPIEALVLTRDTHDGRLAGRIRALQQEGRLDGVTIITQPAATLEAMTAHLATYHPSCVYEPEFVRTCRRADAMAWSQPPDGSTLLCTLDGEVFANAPAGDVALYPHVVRELCRRLADFGFSASLCVQLHDTPGLFLRTPDQVVEAFIDAFGPDAIELHGLDHAMPVEGYEAEWLQQGLDELETRYGVTSRYWAPPGWTLNWRTLAALQQVPQIQAVRGLWSGVNRGQGCTLETFRFPYRIGELWQIPYSYVDWMFMDYRCQPADWADIPGWHERLARFAGAGPCLMETVVHPFRLVGPDYRERLEVAGRTLETYAIHGVRWAKVADVRGMLDAEARHR
ncbi:MAG: hypothetical protein IID40_03935 [Planctomycetes bacterium]|nr:hypothetical protein [Planctomycetota bacterium]